MRKLLCLILASLILSVACMVFAFGQIDRASDQVELRETVVFGDKGTAEGLIVHSKNNYLERLHWNTTYVIGNQPITDTTYHFTPGAEYERSISASNALYLTSQLNSHFSPDDENPTGLSRALKELYDSMGPNEEKEVEVYVKDYYDYYPLTGWIELPGYLLDWNMYTDIEDWFSEEELAVIKGLENFFRIPVLENDTELVSLTTNAEKNIVGIGGGSVSGDDFPFNPIAPYTDEAIYIVFDAHTYEERIVDTSYIPGGYGIYRLPYHAKEADEKGNTVAVDIASLTNVYPLDPGIYINGMHISETGEELLLHTLEDGTYYLTVIDLSTMGTLQKLELGKLDANNWNWRLYEGDGFLAFLLNDQIMVAQRQTDGTYVITLAAPLLIGKEDSLYADYYLSSDVVMAYDGERLAVADTLHREYTNEDSDYYWREEVCGFYTAVYDTSGLTYFGTYESSLDAGEDLSDEFHQCTPDRYSLSVSWN